MYQFQDAAVGSKHNSLIHSHTFPAMSIMFFTEIAFLIFPTAVLAVLVVAVQPFVLLPSNPWGLPSAAINHSARSGKRFPTRAAFSLAIYQFKPSVPVIGVALYTDCKPFAPSSDARQGKYQPTNHSPGMPYRTGRTSDGVRRSIQS